MADPNICERCGKCKVKDVLELAEKHEVQCAAVTGGRLAVERVGRDDVHAVVAIACEKEIRDGMKGIFPKPALGVVNLRPNGPCRDTDVDLEEVEKAICWFLGKSAPGKADA